MDRYLITFRSVTFAQRGEGILQRRGISCALRRTPRILSGRGCGYCLYVRRTQVQTAAEMLREQGIPFGKVYAVGENGNMEEQAV